MKEINMKKYITVKEKCENLKQRIRLYKDSDYFSHKIPQWEAELAELKADMAVASAKIIDAIQSAEGRASARTILPWDIARKLNEIEDKLGIAKKALEGVSVDVDIHAQDFPKAYKYTPESTQFSAVFRGGSWRITNIERNSTRRYGREVVVTHTDESRKAILDRFTTF